jgi:hypothetical protein
MLLFTLLYQGNKSRGADAEMHLHVQYVHVCSIIVDGIKWQGTVHSKQGDTPAHTNPGTRREDDT